MDKRHRSPSYPQMSIKEAVDRVGMLHKAIGSHATSRDVIAKGLGYSSVSGTSATAIGNLYKYGLLDGRGEEIRVSDRAMQILHPHSDAERKEALRAAALEPELFRDLAQRFPGNLPNDEILRNYLVRNKFAPQAVEATVLAYKETIEFVGGLGGGYDSADKPIEEPAPMVAAAPMTSRMNPEAAPPSSRLLGRWDFVDGGWLEIKASADVDQEEALNMAMTLINMRKAELERKRRLQKETYGEIGE